MRLKPGKLLIKFIIGFAIILIVIFFAISPIAKYLIEKKSEEWTGRKITMNSLFINLLNWNITIKGIKIYEYKSKEVFFSSARIHTEVSLLQLISGKYMLKTIQVISPVVVIEQEGEHFNFDDLIKRFSSEDTTTKEKEPPSEQVKYRVEAIEITGGNITYRDKHMHQEIVMEKFRFKCPLLAWDEPIIKSSVDFSLKSGGKIFSTLALNSHSLAYTLTLKLDELDLLLAYPYLKDYIKSSYAGGLLSSDLFVKGDFDTPQAIALRGSVNLDDFRLDDAQKQTVASWKSFDISIDSINVAADKYNFGKISLVKPYMLVEMYAEDNNFTRMMMPSGADTTAGTAVDSIDYSNPFTMMAGYIKQISKDYIISNYTAGSAEILNGHIVYNDYTLEDRFTYDLEELSLQSGRIDSQGDSLTFNVSCLANRSGRLNSYLAFDPKDYKNMAVNFTVDKMRISDFNPYSKFYVAHAFVEGLLKYASTNTIQNGIIASSNIMHIEKIEVSRRIGKGLYSMPLRLAIVLLRDRHGNIDLDIPVKGDLKDPTYKLGKVIWKILGNLVVKAATAPYTLLSKALGVSEEELKLIRFDYLQKSFEKQQMKGLDLISQSLKEQPGLKVALVQVASHENEKEALALFLTKKDYYIEKILQSKKDSLSADDLKSITSISNNDSLYNSWLNTKLLPQAASPLPAQLKSRLLKGEEWLNQQVDILFDLRNRFIINYLVNEKQVDSLAIKISNTADEKSAQFESTPRYTIDFVVDE
jgi:hypothetical protein